MSPCNGGAERPFAPFPSDGPCLLSFADVRGVPDVNLKASSHVQAQGLPSGAP